MSNTMFLRALADGDKGTVLEQAIQKASDGQISKTTYIANTTSFSQIPSSTFAYWVSEKILKLFTLPSLFSENDERSFCVGLQTSDDFQFLRLWWEVLPDRLVRAVSDTSFEQILKQTFHGKDWVPFAKGGAYSPYYADLHLVVNWQRDGEKLRNFKDSQTQKQLAYIRNPDFYFRPGLTWSLRTNRLSFRILPSGCIFGHKGPAVFVLDDNLVSLSSLAALVNSQSFLLLVQTLVARVSLAQSFEVGLIESIPILQISEKSQEYLAQAVHRCIKIKQIIDSLRETSHLFHVPLLTRPVASLLKRSALIQTKLLQTMQADLENLGMVQSKLRSM